MPSAYGSFSRCSVQRNVALSPNSASPRTAVRRNPAARIWRSSVSAWRHFSWNNTAGGIWARCRASGVNHASGKYSAAPTIHARTPGHRAAVTATWQFATLPNVP
jgi:hypothetical protein